MRSALLALGLSMLSTSACIEPEAPKDIEDRDGDGYPGWQDCDDGDPRAHPEAVETCDGIDQDCDGERDERGGGGWFLDVDGDGWGAGAPVERCTPGSGQVSRGGDCDDADPSRSPGADEVCDGLDNDCDVEVDEQAVDADALYVDLDGDGYGNPALAVERCAGEGLVDNAGDCQDSDPLVHPGGEEVCDEHDADEDCDGLAEDADEDATGQGTFYLDRDGDGVGSDSEWIQACDAPPGYAEEAGDCDDLDEELGAPQPGWQDADGDGYGTNALAALACPDELGEGASTQGGDCDDADPDVSPGASETWYDGLDQDCDGGSDYDADQDGYEASAWGGGDCDDTSSSVSPGTSETWYDGLDQDCDGESDYDADGDGYTASAWGGEDCDDEDARAWPGSSAAAWGAGADQDCDGAEDLAVLVLGDTESAAATGSAVAGAGDTDGDGLHDLVVGAYMRGASSEGALFVVLGPGSGLSGIEEADGLVSGASREYLGWDVAAAGDVDGDGFDDVLAGAINGSTCNGSARVFHGPLSGSLTSSDAEGWMVGSSSSGYLGYAVAGVGDTDGDGSVELLLGAPYVDWTSADAGAALLVSGDLEGEAGEADLVATLQGATRSGRAGLDVSSAGDMDGDGLADLIVGAPNTGRGTTERRAYVVRGPVSGTLALSDADAVLATTDTQDYFGSAVAGGEDVDGDGYDDVLVGAPYRGVEGSRYAGAAFLFQGPLSGTLTESAKAARYAGDSHGMYLGSSASFVGDVDGDGDADVAIGAPRADVSATDAGLALLFCDALDGSFYPDDALLTLRGEGSYERLGTSVAGPGDVGGDGLADWLVGSPGRSSAGAALLVAGGSF